MLTLFENSTREIILPFTLRNYYYNSLSCRWMWSCGNVLFNSFNTFKRVDPQIYHLPINVFFKFLALCFFFNLVFPVEASKSGHAEFNLQFCWW